MNGQRNLAPIALFVFNRVWHTRQVIEALQKNRYAKESDLIIFSDGPRDLEDDAKVNLVRKLIDDLKEGFKSVRIINSIHNKGLANSIISGVTNVINEYQKIIVLEDDLIASPYFLQYMNDALDYYESNAQVISIHGYNYPIKQTAPSSFFLKGADCWGWATWRRGWDLFEQDGKKLLERIVSDNKKQEFDFNGSYPYTKMLKDQIAGNNNSWAIRWYASAFLNDKLTLYPGVSLVQNIGNDSSGTHCNTTSDYIVNLNTQPLIISPIKIEEDTDVKKYIQQYLSSIRKKSFLNKSTRVKNTLKKLLKVLFNSILPPFFQKHIRLLVSKTVLKTVSWEGNYSLWEEARGQVVGYDSDLIIEKVKNALLKVKDGQAVYERDSVVFDKIEYSWPLLASLLWVNSQSDNRLHVLDFGGSLGSTYYQNKFFLDTLNNVKWYIVEQQKFVNCGKEHFESSHISFYDSVDQCLKVHNDEIPDVLLLSSVLQYLQHPYKFIEEILKKEFPFIIIDRTSFLDSQDRSIKDRLTIQHVSKDIYEATYPAWFFNRSRFLNSFRANYDLIEGFESFVGDRRYIDKKTSVSDQGFIFRRKA